LNLRVQREVMVGVKFVFFLQILPNTLAIRQRGTRACVCVCVCVCVYVCVFAHMFACARPERFPIVDTEHGRVHVNRCPGVQRDPSVVK